MKVNKLYEVEFAELYEEMNLGPEDFLFYDPDCIQDFTLHCDNESFKLYTEMEEEKFNDPNIEAEEYRLFVNMLDAIKHFRTNYGIYCDVIVRDVQWPARPSPKEEL